LHNVVGNVYASAGSHAWTAFLSSSYCSCAGAVGGFRSASGGTSIQPGRTDRLAAGVAASAPRNDVTWSFRLAGAGVGGSGAVQRRVLQRCAKNARIRDSHGARCAATGHVVYRLFIYDG